MESELEDTGVRQRRKIRGRNKENFAREKKRKENLCLQINPQVVFSLWTITGNFPAHILSNTLILRECKLESVQTEWIAIGKKGR